ncbi:MAG: beta-ketoacyl synthase N-terminal-like domain-containing protein [Nanoarchaeota archaeon]|nr:beta-ketoacyl synthase N-terminal-like domain-containing protein [Nanoarchaeota archaeon]
MHKNTADIPNQDDACIVGIGCILPGSPNPELYWKNIIRGKSLFRQLPKERINRKLYLSNDRNAEDKTYSLDASFVPEYVIKNLCKSLKLDYSKVPRLQVMSLEAARQAISGIDKKFLKSKKISAVIGCGWLDEGSSYYQLIEEQASLEEYIRKSARKNQDKAKAIFAVRNFFSELKKNLKPPLDVSFTTSLFRNIKNKFGIKVDGCLIDAACASSLAAMDVAVKKLKSRQADIVITGGIDSNLAPENFVVFSKTGTLAQNGCYPFDKKSDGIALGEGAVIFALQRLGDAIKEDNKIYGIVRSIGSSSDGRGSSLFSPSVAGQVRALNQAYKELGVKVLDYIECHGTGTVIGDTTELQSLDKLLKKSKKVPIGSVKALIGHTKAAAGAASLLKCILAIIHKELPPSPYFNKIISGSNKVYINKNSIKINKKAMPMRLGISSFGFGGINYHLVLDEFAGKSVKSSNNSNYQKDVAIVGFSYVPRGSIKNYIENNIFNIPPNSVPHIDDLQMQALIAVLVALNNSNINLKNIGKERISVISGSCIAIDMLRFLSKRLRHFEFNGIPRLGKEIKELLVKHKEKYPSVSEDTGPGTLNNVIAGRVCNIFDFWGKSFNVDADFNSFASALQAGILEVQQDSSDLVVVIGSEEKLSKSGTHVDRNGVACLLLASPRLSGMERYPVLSIIKNFKNC